MSGSQKEDDVISKGEAESEAVDKELDDRIETGEVESITLEIAPVPERAARSPELSLPAEFATAAQHPSIAAGTIKCLPAEHAMVTAAYALLNEVLSSQLFKAETLAAAFTETSGLTNQGIYDLAVSRSPIEVDFTMFTGTFMQNHVWKTHGYEDSRYPTVCFANRYFIKRADTCASLILHETMHIVGFSHRQAKHGSVPYTMNRIFEKVARELGI